MGDVNKLERKDANSFDYEADRPAQQIESEILTSVYLRNRQ